MRVQSSCIVAALSVAFIACAKSDNPGPTMDATARTKAGPQSPTNNGVSQLNNNNARTSVTDTGAARGSVPSTGSATTTTSPANRGANRDSVSRRPGMVPAAHP